MSDDFFGDGQGQPEIGYKPSSHQFTDPVRYFKANDPYYWEVDNLPIQQLESNILWLKDQISVGGVLEVGDVKRSNLLELRPASTGDNRIVTVEPGRFMGRVNDAYGTGISRLVVDAYANYKNLTFRKQVSNTLPDGVLQKLVGNVVTSMVGNNGLYQYLQTHVSNAFLSDTVGFGNFFTFDVKNDLGISNIYNIPKIKLALWQQDTTTHNYYPDQTDLQQLAVEWTRAWGAPFRTALVNVENKISIEVPPFSEADYANNTTYVPSVRVDLLFVYTKPIDASSTIIAKPVGSTAGYITSPQLGIVKGAGVIALHGGGKWNNASVDTDFLFSSEFTDNRQDPAYWFNSLNAFGPDGNPQISSPMADLLQDDMGTSGVFGNFPSPDDLMNLAPYLAQELNGTTSLALIGQSILPIAYIFVKKGATNINNSDILDIRPFFRTAELAYNERCGVAAANPPASIANPFVTEANVRDQNKKLYEALESIIPKLTTNSITVERTEFIKPQGAVVFKKLGLTQLQNIRWDIPSIPEADKENLVSVQFKLTGQDSNPPYGDIDNVNKIFFTAGGMGPVEVTRLRLNIAKGDLDGSDGISNQIFNFPVDVAGPEGSRTVKILTTIAGGNNENEVHWFLDVWGYTTRDVITPVTITF